MKMKMPSYKTQHTQVEKDYFKSIADQVRQKRLAASTTNPPVEQAKGATP
jgi:hypothetical protein